ncbi:MAG: tyrosine-type recombinase/integrase [Proteobacteria bacterium]|nr:tyrosine-type recombinase/integrase [Pseudomonadota bacterium]
MRKHLSSLSHFTLWAASQQFELSGLVRQVDRFLYRHLPQCRCGYPVIRKLRDLRAALNHLIAVVVKTGVRLDAGSLSQVDEHLQLFDHYLEHAKGLAYGTRRWKIHFVRPLLLMTGTALPSPNQLRRFLHQAQSRLSIATIQSVVKAVRSYLRFRAFQGESVEHLTPIVMSPACWRLAVLPKTLSSDDLQRLLDAFPPGTPSRHRGYAIIRCAVDLGLRSSEITSLALDDIDWAAGTVRINKAKSRRTDVLPLPHVTGTAIAEYIRLERPQTNNRRVFVRLHAPVDKPVTRMAVIRVIAGACQRAGLPCIRPHILRHTFACRLLNAGGTLKEVADVLRHRSLNTSMIYAKVDLTRLAAVAMPWPGSPT